MTKDDIAEYVYKRLDVSMKNNQDEMAKNIGHLLSCLVPSDATAETKDAVTEHFTKTMLTLCENMLVQSSYITIHALSDAGLLKFDEPQ